MKIISDKNLSALVPAGNIDLSGRKALILGLGSIGQFVSVLLAKAGVKDFTVLEEECISRKSISSEVLSFEADAGKNIRRLKKLEEALSLIDPSICIRQMPAGLSRQEAKQFFDGKDFCIDTRNDMRGAALAEDLCDQYKLPLFWTRTSLWQALTVVCMPGSESLGVFAEHNRAGLSKADLAVSAAMAAGLTVQAVELLFADGKGTEVIGNKILSADLNTLTVRIENPETNVLEARMIHITAERYLKNVEVDVREDMTINDLIDYFDLGETYVMKNGNYVPDELYDKPILENGDKLIFTVSVLLD